MSESVRVRAVFATAASSAEVSKARVEPSLHPLAEPCSIFERTLMSSLCTCLKQKRKKSQVPVAHIVSYQICFTKQFDSESCKDTSRHILEVSERKMIEIDTDKESETESSRFRLKRETCMHEKANTSVKSLSLKAKKRNVYARESQHVS